MKAHCVLIIWVTLLVAVGGWGYAQFPEGEEPRSRLEEDNANNQVRLIWQSYTGWTYFIQQSEDLQDWTYLNVIEPGNGTEKEWAYQLPLGEKFFLRLHGTTASGDPFTGDFDGDGVSNQDEVALGLNPLKVDTDWDGMSDGYEMANGLNPLLKDGDLDLDGDGIANREDARPNENTSGRLAISIFEPANGGTFP
ncbi:MAG: hypothetical protein WEB60_08710 [Terrimicrobiaceae bacterium]